MILQGIRVLEMAGLATSQFCGKMLCDFGASVTRIDKIGKLSDLSGLLGYGKLSVSINLKSSEGREIFRKMCSKADVLIEAYRPGVMEKLGLGPEDLMKDNKSLIYTRLTGYGQDGVYSKKAGHDINFLSLTGALSLAESDCKVPYVSSLSDFAGGSIVGTLGILLALYEREHSGHGQIVDVSMLRSCSYLLSWVIDSKLWAGPLGRNAFDGGSYFYNTYETKDGKRMAVGAHEYKFYKNLLVGLGLPEEESTNVSQNGYEIFKKKFLEKTQSEWIQVFKDLDACVTPVLSLDEATEDRPEDYVKKYGEQVALPLPEPRFSRSKITPSSLSPTPQIGQHTYCALLELGYTHQEILQLVAQAVVFAAQEECGSITQLGKYSR